MKFLGILLLVFGFVSTASAEELRSEAIKKIIANAIDETDLWAWEDPNDQRGDIWTVNYSDKDDGTGYMVQGRPDVYSFYVKAKEDRDGDRTTDWMSVSVNLSCGSEYDESELYGECMVEAKKVSSRHWKATVKKCTCFTTF